MRDGTLTRAEGDERSQEKWLTLPGNYPAHGAAIRDALNGVGKPGPGQRGDSDNDPDRVGYRVGQTSRHAQLGSEEARSRLPGRLSALTR